MSAPPPRSSVCQASAHPRARPYPENQLSKGKEVRRCHGGPDGEGKARPGLQPEQGAGGPRGWREVREGGGRQQRSSGGNGGQMARSLDAPLKGSLWLPSAFQAGGGAGQSRSGGRRRLETAHRICGWTECEKEQGVTTTPRVLLNPLGGWQSSGAQLGPEGGWSPERVQTLRPAGKRGSPSPWLRGEPQPGSPVD